MAPLPEPSASTPIMFGAPAPAGPLLPWSWAEERLVAARTYWIATTRPDGAPHSRPMWCVWLPDGLWFSTGSLAKSNLATNPAISVNIEGDEVVIVEGVAARERDTELLLAMCEIYGQKYDYPITAVEGEVRDSFGNHGPAYRVVPRRVFGWDRNMANPTRWRF